MKRPDNADTIDLPPLTEYVSRVRSIYGTGADDEIVSRTAQLHRLIAYHSARLENDPGDSWSTDATIKLSTLVLRYEDELQKRSATAGGTEPPTLPKPIRRER